MEKNQRIELQITAMSSDGTGIGRHEGMAVFVPLTAVGDTASVKIVKVLKTHAFGRLEKLLEPSRDRISPECAAFEQCGGCAFHHVSYEAELQYKRQRVQDAMERIGGLKVEVLPVLGSEQTETYRNKAEYPVGSDAAGLPVSGFYARRSHRIIPCGGCLIQNRTADAVKDAVLSWMRDNKITAYREETGKGLIRHIFVRTAKNGDAMAVLVINGASLPFADQLIKKITGAAPSVISILYNVNTQNTNVIMGDRTVAIFGPDTLSDTLLGLTFSLSARSFYQVNRDQCEKLYSLALELADVGREDTCLDLYCGAGTITLLLASQAKKAYGVEIVPAAVENAKKNAEQNGIANAEFFCSSADEAAERLQKEGVKVDVLTVDPPRKGLEPALVDTIARIAPKRMVYISCDPATLARDLKLLSERGFAVSGAVHPVDMFPRTGHVETVVLMARVKD